MYQKPETQASVRKQREVKRWVHPQCALSSLWNRIRNYTEQLCRNNALLTASRTNEKSKGNWKTLCNAYLKKCLKLTASTSAGRSDSTGSAEGISGASKPIGRNYSSGCPEGEGVEEYGK